MAINKFNLDASGYLSNRLSSSDRFPQNLPEPLEPLPLFENQPNALLSGAEQQTKQFLGGQIPLDVQEQVERISAERSIKSGIGLGQASRNLVARDLGQTSLDLVQRGIESAAQIGETQERSEIAFADINSRINELNTRRQEFTSEINLRFEQFREDMSRWDDQFVEIVQRSDVSAEQLNLAVTDLISQNQRFMQGIINDLIIANSSQAIANIQANIDELTAFFNQTNTGIRNITGV